MSTPRALVQGLFLTILLSLPAAVRADDELYAPAPPPDAAFVRVLAGAEPVPDAAVGDTGFGEVAPGTATPYRVVPQGSAAYAAGAASGTVDVAAGRFYTVAVSGDGVVLFEDAAVENAAKAALTFYNLTDESLSLRTADGSTSVLADVAAGASASVEVNPVAIDFAVFAGADLVAPVEGLSLRRGGAFTVFAYPDGEGIQVRHVAASTETE